PAEVGLLAAFAGGAPATPAASRSAPVPPIAAARRATSALVRPQHTVWPAEYTSEPGSRPAAAQASRTRPNAALVSSRPTKTMLYSSANLAASRGVRRGPLPPTRIGGRGRWAGLGRAGESVSV